MSTRPAVTRSVVTRASRTFDLSTAMLGDLRQFLRDTEEIPNDARLYIDDVVQVVGPLYRISISHEEDVK